jgi:hypothetical protein
MAPKQYSGNALSRVMTDPALATHGLAAEIAGVRSISVTRHGRFVGVWRQTLGSFDWYPAGYNQPQARLPTADHVSRYMISTFAANSAST